MSRGPVDMIVRDRAMLEAISYCNRVGKDVVGLAGAERITTWWPLGVPVAMEALATEQWPVGRECELVRALEESLSRGPRATVRRSRGRVRRLV